MTREKERLGNAFNAIFDALLTRVRTAFIGQITAISTDKQRVSVQPVLKRLYEGTEEALLLPIIEDVPVCVFGFGDFVMVSEPAEGNYVLLLCSERSIADWLDQGGLIEPTDPRKFSESDAIAIVGLFPDPDLIDSVEEGLTLQKLDGSVLLNLKDDQITARVGSTDLIIEDGLVKSKPTVAPVQTDVQCYGLVPAPGYVSLAAHTHNVTAVGSPTGPPLTTPGPP